MLKKAANFKASFQSFYFATQSTNSNSQKRKVVLFPGNGIGP